MLAHRSLPNDATHDGLHSDQLGSLGESAVDRAFLTGSGGRLFSYLPLIDTHGVDRAYAWDGRGPVNFVQVKATEVPVASATYEWEIHGGTFVVHERLWCTLLVVDPVTGDARNDCFQLSAAAAGRLAHPHRPGATRYVLQGSFANPCKLSPYHRQLRKLWKTFAPRGGTGGAFREPQPQPPADDRGATGGMFQLSFATELMGARQFVLVFRPLNDLAGRNLLVQLVGTDKALYIEVKGRTRRHSQYSIQIPVPRSTFVASPDFWLVFYYFDGERETLFEDCWLVPSIEFERRTASQADKNSLNFQADLRPERDAWRQWRHPLRAQAEVVVAALRELP